MAAVLNTALTLGTAPDSRRAQADATIAKAKQAQKSDDPKAMINAARELEGVFMSMIFEEMAKTVDQDDGLFPKTPGMEMYQQWFRGQVAKDFSQGGGIGLGDSIARSFGVSADGPLAPPGLPQVPERPLPSAPVAPVQGPIAPVEGRLTSQFGMRVHPVTGHRQHHDGVDIAVPVGTPVRAPFGGTVVSADFDPRGGKTIVLEHEGGFRSVYAHNSDLRVRPGDSVQKGQVIGLSGNTGRTTGPHLHFGLSRHGKPVDPRRWLTFSGNGPIK